MFIVTNNHIDHIPYPASWSKESTSTGVKLVLLESNSTEYSEVYRDFISKLGRTPPSCEIKRIENAHLYGPFYLHKMRMIKQNDGFHNEMNLYHGTTDVNADRITKFGFNRSYCGIKGGVSYGKGVYFARDSSASHGFSVATTSGHRHMIRARVLVGHSCPGSGQMSLPPVRLNDVLYDSTSDGSSTVFVVYHDNQCYPEYLITYT